MDDLTTVGLDPSLSSTVTQDALTTDLSSTFNLSLSPSIAPFTPEERHHYPKNMLGFTAASAFIIAILGTFGNLLTIIALPLTKKLRNSATAFVVNLAVVELLFCVFILPMSGGQYLYLQSYGTSLLNNRDCIFFTTLRYTLTQVELQTILAIAFTRALAVATPRTYSGINRPVVIGSYITAIWLYSFFLKLPPAFKLMGEYIFNENTMECDMSDKKSGHSIARFIYILVEAFIPIILIFVLYIFVFIMVKVTSARVSRATKKNKMKPPLASTSSNSVSTATAQDNPRKGSTSSFKSLKNIVSDTSLRARFTRQSSNMSQRLGTSRRDLRVARTIFIIFILVLVCSVPVMFVHMVDRKVEYPRRFLLLHVLYWVQYCLNVGVYVLMNRQYRDAYIDCLARVFPRFKRHHGRRFFWEKASASSRPVQKLNNMQASGGAHACQPKDTSISDIPDQGSQTLPGSSAMPQGRLNTIQEGHSSSAANDSVFSDPDKKLQDPLEAAPRFTGRDSIDEEEGNGEEKSRSENQEEDVEEHQALMDKEHWLKQNGSMRVSLSDTESKV